MGSLSTYRPKGTSHREFFEAELLHSESNYRIIDSFTKGGVFYAALEHRPTGKVAGFTVKFQWNGRGAQNFTYKTISEEEGPYTFECPARILDLLTPTESVYANEWREKCRKHGARVAALSGVKPGDVVEFVAPIRFQGGAEYDALQLVNKRGLFQAPLVHGRRHDFTTYRVTTWKDLARVPATGEGAK